jgi:hypothetical protein
VGSVGRTDANDQTADGESSDGVLDQVRRTSSQQSRRGPHAVVVVGRLEGFATAVRYCTIPTEPGLLTIPWRRAETLAVLRGRNGPSRRGDASIAISTGVTKPF